MPDAARPELRKFRRPMFAPPGGEWAVNVDGVPFSSRQCLSDVVSQVAQFLRANGKPVPDDLSDSVEDAICAKMPPGVCTGSPSGPRYEMLPGFFEVCKAMEDLFKGREFQCCSLQEAEDRMRICLACPRHTLQLCTACDGLRATARKFVMGRKTKFDSHSGLCSVYRVPLCALVHLRAMEDEEGTPETCWVKHGK